MGDDGIANFLNAFEPGPIRHPLSPRIATTVIAAPAPAVPRFELLTAADLDEHAPLRWLIRHVLPSMGLATLYGPPGSAKSFLMLDLVAACARGTNWFGYRVTACRVVVLVLEGEAGFRRRIKAWEEANTCAFPDVVRFVFQAFDLLNRTDVLALAGAIDAAGGADLVVVDTLNRATPGADENNSRDAGLTIQGSAELQGMFGGLLLLVHHNGKDSGRGMRGHSSLAAAMDAVLEVTRADDRREWRLVKSKDDADGHAHVFRLTVVDLGSDEDGEPVTSCVITPSDPELEAPAGPRPRLPRTGNQKIVLDALAPLFRESSAFGKAGAPSHRPCLLLDDAITSVRDRLAVDPKRRTERAREAISGLVARGVLGLNEGWIWLV